MSQKNRDKSPLPRRMSGKLKSLRKRLGVSQIEMAERMQKTQSWISLIENGQISFTEEVVSQWCEVLEISRVETSKLKSEFVSEHEVFVAWQKDPRGHSEMQLLVSQHERTAKIIRDVNTTFVGGLYQCPQYIEAAYRAVSADRDDSIMFEFIQGRLARQSALHDSATHVEGIVLESALTTMFGSRDVMVRQLEHLTFLIERGLADLAVVPSTRALPVVPYSNWIMFDDQLAIIEVQPGQISFSEPNEIAMLSYAYTTLWDIALKDYEAISYIMGIARKYEQYEQNEF